MEAKTVDRKGFLKAAGMGACACACAAAGVAPALEVRAEEAGPGAKSSERAVKRVEFADKWVKRFFDVVDRTLDPATRRKLMMANGSACFSGWIEESGRTIVAVEFEKWAAEAAKTPRPGLTVEGKTIGFQFNASAETGGAAPEGVCLCSMAESKPAGLSPTYCFCSLGYVREMWSRRFGRDVDVELIESVLSGGKRCRFKVTVL
jgi:hypothetical protein